MVQTWDDCGGGGIMEKWSIIVCRTNRIWWWFGYGVWDRKWQGSRKWQDFMAWTTGKREITDTKMEKPGGRVGFRKKLKTLLKDLIKN